MSSVDKFIGSERILEVSSRSHIGFAANCFIISDRETEKRASAPSGDVLALVLESEAATITSAALAACGERGIPVIVCQRHLPIAVSLSLDVAWNSAQVRRLQARALRGEAAARRLWRRTVRAKLLAQAATMDHIGAPGAQRVKRIADGVRLDGQETMEAQAAAIYWRAVFANFQRSDESDFRNGLLNWGYAVLLATLGRALVALGLDPCLGFGHAARTNGWALACDLMEPLRPTVDAALALSLAAPGGDAPAVAKAAILRPFANDGPVKRTVLEIVRGYRAFLEDGNEAHVRYPHRPLLA